MVPEKSRALKIKDFWYWNLTWKIESWNLLLLFSIFRTMFFHPVKGRVGCIEGYHNFVKFNVPSYYRASRRKVDTGLLWKNIWRAKFQIEGFIFWLDGCGGNFDSGRSFVDLYCMYKVEKQYITFYFFVRWQESFVTCFLFFRLLEFLCVRPRVAVDLFACWQSKYSHFESSKFGILFHVPYFG